MNRITVDNFNKELIEYFSNRGWRNGSLFLCDGSIMFYLYPSYFKGSDNSNNKSNWLTTTNKKEFNKYINWFFEHIKPFWEKYDLGQKTIVVQGRTLKPLVTYNGKVIEIKYN